MNNNSKAEKFVSKIGALNILVLAISIAAYLAIFIFGANNVIKYYDMDIYMIATVTWDFIVAIISLIAAGISCGRADIENSRAMQRLNCLIIFEIILNVPFAYAAVTNLIK